MNIKNLSRAFGVIWIVASLLWAGLGIAGIIYGLRWVDATEIVLDNRLALVADSMESVDVLMIDVVEVVSSTHQSLETVQKSTHDASVTLEELRPLVWETTKVITIDVPHALDGVHDSMPSLIETAKSIDETLTWLSAFNLTIPNPFGQDWTYDLGIMYHPETSLDKALEGMSQNLDGVPDDLRDLDENLQNADGNLIVLSDDLANLAEDLESMNKKVKEIIPEMMTLAGSIHKITIGIEETRLNIPETFESARKILKAFLGLLIFTQIPSVYMGLLLVSGALFSNNRFEDKS